MTSQTRGPLDADRSRGSWSGAVTRSGSCRAATLAMFASLASCTAIGPTVQVAPGPGTSQVAFDADRAACGRATDQQLQPVANRMTTSAALSQQAANNQWLQQAYNTAYAKCMVARGDIVPTFDAVEVAAGPASLPLSPSIPLARHSESGSLGDGWQLLRLSYHGATGHPRDEDDVLWPREIANPPGGPGTELAIYSTRFGDSTRAVHLSIAGRLEPACDNGPQGALVTRDYGVCPGKLALIEHGRLTTVRSTGPLCFEVINEGGVRPGAPGWKDPRLWGTRGRYDIASGTIELVTMQDGRLEPTCAKRLYVR